MDVAFSTGFLTALIALQTFWVSRSLGRLESQFDGLRSEFSGLRAEVHRDLTAQTEAIVDLRERVSRLEG